MRVKALLALLGLGLALMLMAGCSDSDNEEITLGTVTGTITNASTGLAQPDATVTLFQNGVAVPGQTFTTGANGVYTFNNVQTGGNYTITVSSATNAFTTKTTSAFTVTTGTNTVDVVVGSGLVGSNITGVAGTSDPNATFTVEALQNGVVVATNTTGATVPPANGPAFTLTNVPTNVSTILRVTSTAFPGVVTFFGPVTVPDAGVSDIQIFTKTPEQLDDDTNNSLGTVPPANGTATVVAYVTGGGTITVGNQTSTAANPTFITNLSPQTSNVTVQNVQTFNFGSIQLQANTVYVFRVPDTI